MYNKPCFVFFSETVASRMCINTHKLSCHSTKPANNHLQLLYHLVKRSLVTTTTNQPKITLQLPIFRKKFLHDYVTSVQ